MLALVTLNIPGQALAALLAEARVGAVWAGALGADPVFCAFIGRLRQKENHQPQGAEQDADDEPAQAGAALLASGDRSHQAAEQPEDYRGHNVFLNGVAINSLRALIVNSPSIALLSGSIMACKCLLLVHPGLKLFNINDIKSFAAELNSLSPEKGRGMGSGAVHPPHLTLYPVGGRG
jgi:hypothetical protein